MEKDIMIRFLNSLDTIKKGLSNLNEVDKAEVCKLIIRTGQYSIGTVGEIGSIIDSVKCPCDIRDMEELIIEYVSNSNEEAMMAAVLAIKEILENPDIKIQPFNENI